ncbi:phage holin family protein [Pedobacter sp. SD-b]|uniref:Phage holin family protein n=1 Tax=Pedobacter segetis TaxID=2793069 RepID=A0ABS1BKJ7_9SPHI|nr:phage holin family protein [Pedobacter segetis]MBK0383414.1 phage holin family protein [Pedobacter segetis]
MENNDQDGMTELYNKIKDYVTTVIELNKLKVINSVVTQVGSLVSIVVFLIVCLFFLVFLSIGISVYLCRVLDSDFAGYFIVALFYLIVALMILIGRNKIIAYPLANKLVKIIFEDKKD